MTGPGSSQPHEHRPTNEHEQREAKLRQLLSEAVEPLQPAPGGQARLLAKVRAQRPRERRMTATRLRWTGGVLGLVAVLVAGSVVVAGRTGDSRSSSAGTSSSTADRAIPQTPVQQSSQAAAVAGGTTSRAGANLQLSASPPVSASPDAAALAPNAAHVPDLDGDGRADVFSLSGDVLSAQLSTAGRQSVTLRGIGPGAHVLGVRELSPSAGPVVVVQLRSGPPAAYALVGVRNARLTVLATTATPPN